MPNEKQGLSELFTKQPEAFLPENPIESTREELPEDLKNRHVRRLEAKLQSEREASIAREAKIEALTEAQKLRQETSTAGWEEKARRIYGNDKPENAAASDLLVQSIKEATTAAKQEALEEARREYRERDEESNRESKAVQGYIEQIEDQYGIDFTSTASARESQKEFRDLWFRLSPKDSNGDVLAYADPTEVYEIFKSRQPANRAQEVASRGMVRSQQTEKGVSDDATVKYLRDNGILDDLRL